MSDDLPMGWVETELGEIFEFNPRHSSSIDRSINVSFVPMPSVCEHNGIILPHSTKKLEEVWKGYTHFQNDDVIFAKITPCMENGKIALASNLHNDIACGSTEFHVLRSLGVVLPLYVWYFLRQRSFLRDAEQRMTGAVGQRRVPVNFLKETNLAIPPLNEQRRIVDKLERIGDRHRTARNELNHIPKLIARYKQAVLAAAFRGDLTADWRENPEIKNGELWSIPIDWNWKQIKDIAEIASNLVQTSEVMDLPHIAPNHIESGVPRLLPFKTVREDNVISAKHRFFSGQIIYSKIRPYLRKAVIVDFEGVCSADMYPINARCNSKYLLYWLISEDFNNLAVEHQGRTVLPKINQVGLYKLPIPVPSELEQKEIVRRVEKMFEKIDMMEQEYQKAAKLCDRLEQATLAKAFRGELVPQDPDDEPASVLLEQVKREKGKGKIKTKK
jgi:type I restriction enzyme S subunit